MTIFRVQIECDPESADALQKLVSECALESPAQLFTSALDLFAWAVAERRAGRVIACVDEIAQVYKEVNFPGAPAVRPTPI